MSLHSEFTSISCLRKIVAALLAFVLLFTNSAVISTSLAADSETDAGNAEALRTISSLRKPTAAAEALQAVNRLAAALPTATFDSSAKADEVGANPEHLFAFVRDQISFEAYEGVLRGAHGTLVARAGNACDKSLLLAEMLHHAGRDVRFAGGELPAPRMKTLLAQLFSRHDPAMAAPGSEVQAIELLKPVSKAFWSLIASRWSTHVKLVADNLQNSGVSVRDKAPTSMETLSAETRRHVWVEFKEGEKWIALDPSFADAKVGSTYAEKKEEWAELPGNLFHKVTIRLTIAEEVAGLIEEREILHEETTAAAVNGRPITMQFVVGDSSDKWNATSVLRIGEREVRGEQFEGSLANLAGASTNFGSRLFKKPRELPDSNSKKLNGVRLDFTFISPSSFKETVRRDIFDVNRPVLATVRDEKITLLGSSDGNGATPNFLRAVFGISVVSGGLSSESVLSYLKPELPEVQAVLDGYSRGEKRPPLSAPESARQQTLFLYVLAATFHAASHKALSIWRTDRYPVLMYEATPRVAIASAIMSPDNGRIVEAPTLDLRRNVLRAVAENIGGEKIILRNISRGIVDAAIEHVLAGDLPSAIGSMPAPISALAVMDAALKQKVALSTVTEKNAEGIACASLTKADLSSAIARGEWLLAPSKEIKLNGKLRFGWWSINPATGESLSVMDSGLHGTGIEYGLPWYEYAAAPVIFLLCFVNAVMIIATSVALLVDLFGVPPPAHRELAPNIRMEQESMHSEDEVMRPGR